VDFILTADNLKKQYGRYTALDGFSIHVPRGSIYGFVGRNGAGKTTLIRIITGLQEATEGSFCLYGVENHDKRIGEARQRMGAVVESPALYLDMSAEENLRQQYRVLGIPSFDTIPELLKLVGLENTGKKTVKKFSLGMKQRLGIAIALAGNPDFLVLDEPTNGLDPQGIIELRELILKLNRERKITVLISSHILDELSRLASHYGIIDKGRMIKELSAGELHALCRKRMRVEVTDMTVLARVLVSMALEFNILSPTQADIFAKVNITQLVLELAKEGCEIISLETKDENLESFFISITGGYGIEQTIDR